MADDSIYQIQQQVMELENKMLREVEKRQMIIKELPEIQRLAAQNLVHYLTIRNEDIRQLQDQLHVNGLSALTNAESHIHSQMQSIRQRLNGNDTLKETEQCTYEFSRKDQQQKSKILFGEKMDDAIPYIMVTFDSPFADNYGLIKNLLLNGMNVARINCAHDDEATWARMIHHVKRAVAHSRLPCKIFMDLAGPKIRTQLLAKGHGKKKVKIKEGKLVWLSESKKDFKKDDIVISPGMTGIIPHLKKGQRVLIDDGVIKGIIEKTKKDRAALRIVRIGPGKRVIKNHKGINFPDTELIIEPLTVFDKGCLPFICENADIVGYSFVRNPADLATLQGILKQYTEQPPHIIIKIETQEAVKNLPALLLQGMHQEAFGVMIARGDLAVEIGFERMAEIQEEILWICEAAHVPVVWATQVLETLNKSGVATRAEITDVTYAAMAECVMINKGDHTIEVIETLKDILQRTGRHHIKKRFTFRPLSIASRFINGENISPI